MRFSHVFNFVVLSVLFLISLTSPAKESAISSCEKIAELANLDDKQFVGIGSASQAQQAEQLAFQNLAQQIKTTVEAKTTLKENNSSLNFSSSIENTVSQKIVGASILKRCTDDNEVSIIVVLKKDDFLRHLSLKLQSINNEVENFVKIYEKKPKPNFKDIAKLKSLISKKTDFATDLVLCKTFNGCASLSLVNLDRLQKIIDLNPTGDLFYQKLNPLAERLDNEISEILKKDNILLHPSDLKAKPNHPYINVKCNLQKNSPIPGSKDRVYELHCQVNGFSETGENLFSYKLGASALAENEEEAISACQFRLEKK